jgi:pimeloyl-ACP methyl ester carboxylesterase
MGMETTDDKGACTLMPFLDVADGRLYFEMQGEGPPVLLIQGSGVTGTGWDPQVQDLSEDFQCLWFDNRGIGRSTDAVGRLTIEQMVRDTEALLDAVGWPSAHVVGHSMGGVIAQQLALNAPQRIRSLSLLCTFARGRQATRLTPSVLWMGVQTRVGSRAFRRRAFLNMLFPRDFVDSQGAAALAARTAPIIGRDLADSPAIMMRQLAALRAHDCSARLDELSTIPTLVVSAQLDPIALPEYGRELRDLIPGSRYTEIRNASHAVTIQMPQRVSDILRLHFDRSEKAAAAQRNHQATAADF